jgi:mannose-6-phosphate isomerase class I
MLLPAVLSRLPVCLQDYKDDNHKPEMALALEDFEALCGFVSSAELKEQLQQQPELRLCVGEEAASAFLQAEDEQAKPVSGNAAGGQQYLRLHGSWQVVVCWRSDSARQLAFCKCLLVSSSCRTCTTEWLTAA